MREENVKKKHPLIPFNLLIKCVIIPRRIRDLIASWIPLRIMKALHFFSYPLYNTNPMLLFHPPTIIIQFQPHRINSPLRTRNLEYSVPRIWSLTFRELELGYHAFNIIFKKLCKT